MEWGHSFVRLCHRKERRGKLQLLQESWVGVKSGVGKLETVYKGSLSRYISAFGMVVEGGGGNCLMGRPGLSRVESIPVFH